MYTLPSLKSESVKEPVTIIPQGEVVEAFNCEQRDHATYETWRVESLLRLGNHLYADHNFHGALDPLEVASSRLKSENGEDDPGVANILKRIGCCHDEMKSYAASIEAREEAIRIWRANGRPETFHEIQNAIARIKMSKIKIASVGEEKCLLKEDKKRTEMAKKSSAKLEKERKLKRKEYLTRKEQKMDMSLFNPRSEKEPVTIIPQGESQRFAIEAFNCEQRDNATYETWPVESLLRLGNHLYADHNFHDALGPLEVASSRLKSENGEDDLSVANVLKRVGCCHNEIKNYAASIKARQEAVRIWRANGYPDTCSEIQYAISRIEMAKVKMDLPDFS